MLLHYCCCYMNCVVCHRSIIFTPCYSLRYCYVSLLRQVTSVLRERGERISRLEASLKQRTLDLDDTNTQLEALRNTVRELRQCTVP